MTFIYHEIWPSGPGTERRTVVVQLQSNLQRSKPLPQIKDDGRSWQVLEQPDIRSKTITSHGKNEESRQTHRET